MLMSTFLSPAPGVGAHEDAIGKACPYCGATMAETNARRPTRDHVLPRARGGASDGPNNILIVCANCNCDKDDQTLGEFLLALAKVNDPRSYRIAMLISSIYTVLDVRDADRLVSGAIPRPRSAEPPRPERRISTTSGCTLPDCGCVGFCKASNRAYASCQTLTSPISAMSTRLVSSATD